MGKNNINQEQFYNSQEIKKNHKEYRNNRYREQPLCSWLRENVQKERNLEGNHRQLNKLRFCWTACASLCDGLPVISSFFNSNLVSFVLLYDTRPGPIKLSSLPNGMISCFSFRECRVNAGGGRVFSYWFRCSPLFQLLHECVEHLAVIPSREFLSFF